jgi:RNA polymerase sigma-70 factor (ECF subfamily)
MTTPSPTPAPLIPGDLLRRARARATPERWGLGEDVLAAALARSAAARFRDRSPSTTEVAAFVEALHLEDLALASACALGLNTAWEHFVREFRPVLLRIAAKGQQADRARDVADSIYAELYGLEERDGKRRSLFDYYHGRSSLAGWLKAVVAQRLVDRARAARRFEPLPEEEPAAAGGASDDGPDIDRHRYLALVRGALAAAIAGLDARDRLRLSLYYGQDLTLAAIGRAIGESEATASRKLERTRRGLRDAIERRLREQHRLGDAEIGMCFDYARTDPAFDLARTLPPPAG